MEQNEVQAVTLTLDVNQVNAVLAAVQELPYRIADPILKKIIAQAEEQLSPQTSGE